MIRNQTTSLSLGKLPPQSVDIEKSLIGSIINFGQWADLVPWLKPEHFYRDAHQLIWKAISQVEHTSLVSVTNYLKNSGDLESAGGPYYLTKLTENHINPANAEYYGRIIQQMWIKREVIRISNKASMDAYDDSIDCIQLFDDFRNSVEQVEEIFAPGKIGSRIISGRDNEMPDLMIAMQGVKFTGATTGYEKMDTHFRFKPQNFVIINGHDNVGKTFAIIHLAVCVNKLHGWKWILACMENTESRVRQDIIQSKTGKHLSQLTQQEFLSWYEWSLENFTILRISDQITADELLRSAQKVNRSFHAQGFFIDPYNALALPRTKDKFFNSHEYHYEVTGRMRNWIRQNDCSIFLSTHAVTEALRAKHKGGEYDGYPMPPQKADVEGGGKFANRADDFITIHRYTNHPTENNFTHFHVRKIKDTQTGGRPTIVDDPVKLRTMKGYFGLFDEEGNSPLVNVHLPKIVNTPVAPTTIPAKNFYEPEKSDDSELPF